MDNELAYPLVLTDQLELSDDSLTFGGTPAVERDWQIPGDNFAEDQDFKKFFTEQIFPVVTWCRINRMNLEEEWRAIRRMRVQMHDYGRRYYGRSDYYLPFYGRIRSTLVSALLRGLFPSDEYLDVQARGDSDPASAKPVKTLLQWEFEENGEVRRHMEPLIGQYVDWGNTVLKVWYRKELRRIIEGVRDKGIEGSGLTPKTMVKAIREGLAVKARNMLFWFAYPFTADNLDECTMCFEDIEVARGWGEEMFKKEIWAGKEAGYELFKATPIPANYLVSQQDLLTNTWGVTPPATGIMGDRKLADTRVLQEIWTFAPVPRALYRDDIEKPGELVPVQIICGGQNVFMARRNPHWHQRSPYLFAAANQEPGNLHGYAEGRMTRPLQYINNDIANQMNDCGIYALNPISKINPAYFIGAVPPIKPGAAWRMMDIEQGHKFDRPPTDLIQWGLQLAQFWAGAGEDFAGTPPVLQGTRGAKTATSTSILARNASSPIQSRVESLELSIMLPLMRMCWSNAMQFREKAVTLQVMGELMKISPGDLAGDWGMRWLASSQAMNQAQRAQQLIGFLQAIQPIIPLLNQIGYVVDPEPLLRRIYSDGFGMRGFADIIRKSQAAPPGAQPGQQMPPEALGGVNQEQTGLMASALEQVYGKEGAPEPAQGELEDFQQVRGQADKLAAAAGRAGGSVQ